MANTDFIKYGTDRGKAELRPLSLGDAIDHLYELLGGRVTMAQESERQVDRIHNKAWAKVINCPHALEIPPEQVDYAREFAKSFGWHSDDNHIDLCPGCRA
jgi:hypothetical protein